MKTSTITFISLIAAPGALAFTNSPFQVQALALAAVACVPSLPSAAAYAIPGTVMERSPNHRDRNGAAGAAGGAAAGAQAGAAGAAAAPVPGSPDAAVAAAAAQNAPAAAPAAAAPPAAAQPSIAGGVLKIIGGDIAGGVLDIVAAARK